MRMPSEMSKNRKIAVLTFAALGCAALIMGGFHLLRWALTSMELEASPIVIDIIQVAVLLLCYSYFAQLILAEVKRKS
jgi:hypothetical protein